MPALRTVPHLAEVFGRATYLEYDDPATMAEDSKIHCANLAPRYDMDSWTLSLATGHKR